METIPTKRYQLGAGKKNNRPSAVHAARATIGVP
jgi:hypothetical protein